KPQNPKTPKPQDRSFCSEPRMNASSEFKPIINKNSTISRPMPLVFLLLLAAVPLSLSQIITIPLKSRTMQRALATNTGEIALNINSPATTQNVITANMREYYGTITLNSLPLTFDVIFDTSIDVSPMR
ncbi:MAG: hypothetical protein P4M11_11875, partial [Candidatus Pacebacteria bacterium]|nr:hypothetical protein [Candidatus Paceibacterota bacterium]